LGGIKPATAVRSRQHEAAGPTGPRRPAKVVDPTRPRRPANIVDPTGLLAELVW
jgi:hypothetical protein